MTLYAIDNPFDPFVGLAGTGLNEGKIYIGQDGLDPQVSPQACYWDAAGTIPAAQPIPVQGGYPMRLGSPARVYTAETYSMRVRDRLGAQVFYLPSVVSVLDASIARAALGWYPTIGAAIAATVPASLTTIYVLAFNVAGDGGGARYKEVADAGTLEAWQFRSNGNTRRWQLDMWPDPIG